MKSLTTEVYANIYTDLVNSWGPHKNWENSKYPKDNEEEKETYDRYCKTRGIELGLKNENSIKSAVKSATEKPLKAKYTCNGTGMYFIWINKTIALEKNFIDGSYLPSEMLMLYDNQE